MKRKLRNIAAQTRKLLENVSKDLMPSVRPDLGGLCGYGSIMLVDKLKEKGYDPSIISGWGHWFVKCDKYLLDITASQFGQPNVVVRDYEKVQDDIRKERRSHDWWKFANVDDAETNRYLSGYKLEIQRALDRRKATIKQKRLQNLKMREVRR